MVEVIAEDEVVAVNGRFWREAEGDAILVVGFAMFGEGEVGGRGGRGVWEAAVGLYPNIQVDIDMFGVDRNRRRLVDGHNLMRLDIIL